MGSYFRDAFFVFAGIFMIWKRNSFARWDIDFLKSNPAYAKVARFIVHDPKLNRHLYLACGILMVVFGIGGLAFDLGWLA